MCWVCYPRNTMLCLKGKKTTSSAVDHEYKPRQVSPSISCSLSYEIASWCHVMFPNDSTGWHQDSNTSALFNDTVPHQ